MFSKLFKRQTPAAAVIDAQPTIATASKKLLHLVDHAARLRASEFEIIEGKHETMIRMRVADKWCSFGEPWTADEAMKALHFAFNAADGSSTHISMQKMQPQPFSISHQVGFPLPENVIKLRCQKGNHELDAGMRQHTVFKIVYSDDDPYTGTAHDLGCDADV